MKTGTRIDWKAAFAAAALLAAQPSAVLAEGNLAKMKMRGYTAAVLDANKLKTGFSLDKPGMVTADGWHRFTYSESSAPESAYDGLKFGAPVPAVPGPGTEREQWTADVAGGKLTKLKDRQLLYVYPLAGDNANKVINALQTAARSDKPLWTAIVVEYNNPTSVKEGLKVLYSRAAVPVKWDEKASAFFKIKHDAATFGDAVLGAMIALPAAAYANFSAVEKWSASTKGFKTKLAEELKGLKKRDAISPKAWASVIEANYQEASKGPVTWLGLKPRSAFVAVDRKLKIQGMDAAGYILTSKKAWLPKG